MTYVPNPFRVRLAEQQRDVGQYIRSFGAGMLDALPRETLFSQFAVIRSAPGAGKTSLLRMFTPMALRAVLNSEDEVAPLAIRLREMGALRGNEVAVLGVLLSVGRDYKSLLDLGPAGMGSQKVFNKLLDSRILSKTVDALVTLAGLPTDADLSRLEIRVESADGVSAANSLGLQPSSSRGHFRSFGGDQVGRTALSAEQEVLNLLDSLLPVTWDQVSGHATLYSIQLLDGAQFFFDGRQMALSPLLMFDDVHDLAPAQRTGLYERLLNRSISMGRLIAERNSALPDGEVLTNGTSEGRDRTVISLEEVMSTNQIGNRSRTLQRLFGEIANTRAVGALRTIERTEPFTNLLSDKDDTSTERSTSAALRVAEAVDDARRNADQLVGEFPQFARHYEQVARRTTRESALEQGIRWAEFAILVRREVARGPAPLFELEEDRRPELGGADTREAARLFLSRRHRLAYYFGSNALADLASRNVEQYLDLAGDLFDLMISAATLSGSPAIPPAEQHRQIVSTSRALWNDLPQRVPHGQEVRALLHAIAGFSRGETYRPTAPYAPGVTGIAIARWEMDLLVSGGSKRKNYARVSRSIATAVAYNLLEMQEVRSKSEEVVVLYLNRLLCPWFELPLRRGGFREQSLARLGQWMDRTLALGGTLPDPNLPLEGIGRPEHALEELF
jgi:hypothetical protein